MTETAYLAVMSAIEMAKWLWPVAQPGISRVSEKVGNAVGDVLSQKLKDLFGSHVDELDALPENQEEQIVEKAASTLASFQTYSDKKLLDDIQSTLRILLQSPDNYTITDIHQYYIEYVDKHVLLPQLFAMYPMNTQVTAAQQIIQAATVKRRLPELIQDMRHSIQ